MIKKAYTRFMRDFHKLPERKQYIEFFTAILTVPVLLTVIILNVNNLRAGNDKKEVTPTPAVREIVITQPSETGNTTKTVTVTTEPCKPGIGTISIDYPEEGETVSDNPVPMGIRYVKGDYCAVVWSYRVNGGRWSDYDDRSVALSNLSNGTIKFDLRVKSLVNGDEKTLTRTFKYAGNNQPDTTASGSAQ